MSLSDAGEKFSRALRARDLDGALDLLGSAERAYGATHAGRLRYWRAQLAWEAGDRDGARAEARRAVELDPAAQDILFWTAEIEPLTGALASAIDHLRALIQLAEAADDRFFLDAGRARLVLALRGLGLTAEAQAEKKLLPRRGDVYCDGELIEYRDL